MSAVKPEAPASLPSLLDEKRALDSAPVPGTAEPVPSDAEPATATTPAWLKDRDDAVLKAVAAHDEAELRSLSAQPGGFGSRTARRAAWLELLHVRTLGESSRARGVTPENPGTDTASASVVFTPHADENQVLLDTRRAFVAYPRGLSGGSKAAMQEDLQALICSVLQQHPRLSYFQGLHDIVTVLYLTLLKSVPYPAQPGEDEKREWDTLTQATKIVCLYRVRDAMGAGLGPMMGMLRLLRRLLAKADPELYRLSATISPVPTLPFFALSWILTLFSHDIDTLPPVQRIFDYLIARNPISAIYLAVAILVSKRPQLLKLIAQHPEAHEDPSLLHPLFARLPPLYPDTPDRPDPPPPGTERRVKESASRGSRGQSRAASRAASRSTSRTHSPAGRSKSRSRSRPRTRFGLEAGVGEAGGAGEKHGTGENNSVGEKGTNEKDASEKGTSESNSTEKAGLGEQSGLGEKPAPASIDETAEPSDIDEKSELRSLERSTTLAPDVPSLDEKSALKADLDGPILAELEPRAEVIMTDSLSLDASGQVVEDIDVQLETPPARDEEANPFSPLRLSEVFKLADELMEKYPWDGPDVRGMEVLGPGSCVRTFEWERKGRPVDPAPASVDGADGSDGVDGADVDEKSEKTDDTSSDSSEIDSDDSDESETSDGAHTPRVRRTPFTHADAERCIDADVIMPGGDELDDLEEDTPPQPPVKRVPRHFLPGKLGTRLGLGNFGTALALGILVVGIGAVIFGWRRNTAWALWWGQVAQQWLRRSQVGRFLALLRYP